MAGGFKNAIKTCAREISLLAGKTGLIEPEIIVAVDGGICSQMHFYLIGEYLHRKGNKVVYDISWFQENGMDLDNRFVRNLDFNKLFPALPFPVAEGVRSVYYRKLFCHQNDYYSGDPLTWQRINAPAYLCGYYRDSNDMYSGLFKELFRIDPDRVLDCRNLELLTQIRTETAFPVAVHVRRGDLSGYNPAYGHPATIEYFHCALNYFSKKHTDVRFYMFSDEPEWIKENMLPEFGEDMRSRVVVADINDSSKGYMDLTLMSECRGFVTSKGSLGKYAALLCRYEGVETVVCKEESGEWSKRMQRIVEF